MYKVLFLIISIMLLTFQYSRADNHTLIQKIDSLNHLPYSQRTIASAYNLKIYAQNLEQAIAINYEKGIADSYANLALIYFYQGGKTDQSIQYLFNAIQQYEKIDLLEPAANLYSLYGYGLRRRDLKKAEEFMRKGISMAEKISANSSLMAMYDNYGVLKHDLRQLDSAMYFFQKALTMKYNAQDSVGIPYSLNKIGMLHVDQRNFSPAKKKLDDAYRRRLQINDPIGIAENLYFYGIYYDSLGQKEKAIEYYQQAITASQQANYTQLTLKNHHSLAEIFEKNHDYQNALAHFKHYTNFKDSLNDISVLANRDYLEVEFETEKKEKELLVHRAELAESKLKIQKKNQHILIIISLLIITVIISYQFYNYQKQKTLRLQEEHRLKEALLEIETQKQLHQQRLKISRDLHDNIGAQLTFIISSMDNLRFLLKNEYPIIDKKLKDISHFTQNTIIELRDTIWAMNKDKISFEELKLRISNFINKADEIVENIQFSFFIDEQLIHKNINALDGMNLYRIIQEAVNNAVKHAEATEIHVQITTPQYSNHQFQIIITDNGKGFSLKELDLLGNGIPNMKKRAQEINAQIEIDTEIGKGCTIQILK